MMLASRGMNNAHSQAIHDIVMAFVKMMSSEVIVVCGEERLEWRVG
jgi:hypothetical protein